MHTTTTTTATPLRTLSRWALGAYWVVLFVATHVPGESLPGSTLLDSDKLIHAMAYGVLTALALFAWPSAPRWRLAAAMVAYGAIDEVTQDWFGRTTDLYDWYADALGVAAVIAAERLTRLAMRTTAPTKLGRG